jgi:hypothetical protein
MSLDDISNLGRPGLDELVPSRYALQVGEIEVLIISWRATDSSHDDGHQRRLGRTDNVAR